MLILYAIFSPEIYALKYIYSRRKISEQNNYQHTMGSNLDRTGISI